MDQKNDGDNLTDPQDLNSQIAAIEAQADMLARKNETPQEIADNQQQIKKQNAIRAKEQLSLKKPRNFKVHINKWVLIGVGVFLLLLNLAWFIPASRQAALNSVGVRGGLLVTGSQLQSQDGAAPTPLRNFSVQIEGKTYTSGDNDKVMIPGLKLGKYTVAVSKPGYGSVSYPVMVDINSFFKILTSERESALVKAQLKAEGIPLAFTIKDWTSNTPITSGSFAYGDITAQPNQQGVVTLIIPPSAKKVVTVKANFENNYLAKSFELEMGKKNQTVTFVPENKHYFVSKRTGVYSIYSSYLDGSELKEVVKGTSQETSSLQFAVSPSGKYGVMTSTRDGRRDSNGDLVQKLYWVNLTTGKLDELDSARFIYLHDWSGDTITYSYSYNEEKETEQRQRLRSLDVATKNQYDLGNTTGYFGRVHVALGQVIFTKQEGFGKPGSEKGLTVNTVGIKGNNNRQLATNISDFRQLGFEKFAYQTADKTWNEVNLNTAQIKPIEPPREEGTVYISTSSSNKNRVFINFVDGKRVLMLLDEAGATKELATQPGLSGPIRFMNATTVVYRVITPSETADYAVSTLGGKPRKITDVTASAYATPVFFQYY